ncbi:MAG TPA: SLC13 family permease [Anaerolineae bacterium]|mgnify:FL=1|nr:SLC13 family permease [Anaerolineae bacterium]HCK65260.1 SLC13 family permease [Anaerolineae bacterium]
MTIEQLIIFGTLLLTLILFITGRWRYDVVALLSLVIVTLTGLVEAEQAFSGFSNPAVITVAAVLVISRGLQNSGIVEIIGGWLSNLKGGISTQVFALSGFVALLSAFMNNVGALALLLPVVVKISQTKKIPASYLFMPVAFASLLGGMTTLIGTPPNIIASSFRVSAGLPAYNMFDFSPVGVGVTFVGLIFISLIGWRFIPVRKGNTADEKLFDIDNYITEISVPEKSSVNGKRLYEVSEFSKAEVLVVGLIRGNERRMEPSSHTKLQSGDVLIVSADAENIKKIIESLGLEMVAEKEIHAKNLDSDDVTLVEGVVMPNSIMVGNTARTLNLRGSYGVNLLAISRQGKLLRTSLDKIRFQNGDVLLLQSHIETLKEVVERLGCLPLAQRDIRIGQTRGQLFAGLGIFISALAFSALGMIPVQIAFMIAVLLMLITRLVSLKEAYESVDWPIIILLGAMIPLGAALETTGGAELIANSILQISSQFPPVFALTVLLVASMLLTGLVNNAAAVVLMAPIAIKIAHGMNASIDPFLMAITIGASCDFLTPIGHQSNTLVMGPGGYKFSDYWRMGLGLEIIVFAVSIPLLLIFWPL